MSELAFSNQILAVRQNSIVLKTQRIKASYAQRHSTHLWIFKSKNKILTPRNQKTLHKKGEREPAYKIADSVP